MRIINRYRSALLLGGALIGLTACGSTPAATNTTVPTHTLAAAPSATIAQGQPATDVPRTAVVTATETALSSPSATSTGAARPGSIYAALSQSKTAEGYYVLGQPNAPIVMTYYSDFL
jgi:protein-disulfide isomerase